MQVTLEVIHSRSFGIQTRKQKRTLCWQRHLLTCATVASSWSSRNAGLTRPRICEPHPTWRKLQEFACHSSESIYWPEKSGNFFFSESYLDIHRSADVVLVQITLNEGRTIDAKRSLYLAIAKGLRDAVGLRMEDVFISLVEVKKENWSFGNGLAQYAV